MTTVREAIAELGVDGTKLPGDLRRADREFEKAGRRFGRKVGRGLRRGLNKVGNLAGLGAGFGFGQGLREAVAFDDQMQRLGSQARMTTAETDAFATTITEASDATGLARDKLASALDEMVNLEGGSALTSRNLETLSKAMLGTGGDGRELARVMFTLGQNMDISQEAMDRVLGGIDRIGAEASIPFSQLASSYVEVAAAASAFGDKGPDSVFATVAAMQAMRREIPTADEVKTSFTNLANEMVKKRKLIKRKFKVDVTDDEGNARSLIGTLEALKRADLSDADIADVFGKRAAKGLRALLNNFEDYQDLVEKGRRGASQDFLGLRAIERAESSAGRTDRALNRLKQTLARPFTADNVEALTNLVEGLSGAINKSISGWRRLLGLFNKDSRDRKLIDDATTEEKIEAGAKGAGELGLLGPTLGPAAGFLNPGGDLFPEGDIQPFQRPGFIRNRDETLTGVNTVLDEDRPTMLEEFAAEAAAKAAEEASRKFNFELDSRRLARDIGSEVGKAVAREMRPGARSGSTGTRPAE